MTETIKRKPVRVLGVDPGTTTGLAVAEFDLNDKGRPSAIWWCQAGWDEACQHVSAQLLWMSTMLERGEIGGLAVAPEQFTLNAQSAQRGQQGADDALGMLGVVQHEAKKNGVDLGPRETASAAKNLMSDTILKYFDIYHPGQKHSNDAFRHALLLASKRGWLTASMLGRAAFS